MIHVHVAPSARRDLAEAFAYLSRRSSSSAERFLLAADGTFEFIADFPDLGSFYEPSRPLATDFRYSPVKGFSSYLVFYRRTSTTIEVVRVIHSSRDMENMLPP